MISLASGLGFIGSLVSQVSVISFRCNISRSYGSDSNFDIVMASRCVHPTVNIEEVFLGLQTKNSVLKTIKSYQIKYNDNKTSQAF